MEGLLEATESSKANVKMRLSMLIRRFQVDLMCVKEAAFWERDLIVASCFEYSLLRNEGQVRPLYKAGLLGESSTDWFISLHCQPVILLRLEGVTASVIRYHNRWDSIKRDFFFSTCTPLGFSSRQWE